MKNPAPGLFAAGVIALFFCVGVEDDLVAQNGPRTESDRADGSGTGVSLTDAPNEEKRIAGVPVGLLAKVLPHPGPEEIHFLSFIAWNGQDPPPALLAEIRKTIPKARPASRLETIPHQPGQSRTSYRDREDGEFGDLIEVKLASEGAVWTVSVRRTSAPALSGSGWTGKVREAEGRWQVFERRFWDE